MPQPEGRLWFGATRGGAVLFFFFCFFFLRGVRFRPPGVECSKTLCVPKKKKVRWSPASRGRSSSIPTRPTRICRRKKWVFASHFLFFFVCSLKKKEPVTLHSKNQNETVMKEGGNEFLFELRQQKTGSLQELVRVRLLFFFVFFWRHRSHAPSISSAVFFCFCYVTCQPFHQRAVLFL